MPLNLLVFWSITRPGSEVATLCSQEPAPAGLCCVNLNEKQQKKSPKKLKIDEVVTVKRGGLCRRGSRGKLAGQLSGKGSDNVETQGRLQLTSVLVKA